MTSYNRALGITVCKSIETTLRTRILFLAGALIQMSGGRLPKQIVFGNNEGAVRRRRVGRRKNGRIAYRATFRHSHRIAGDWKETGWEVEVWVETGHGG